MKFERTKDGQLLDDIFHWEKNVLCPERGYEGLSRHRLTSLIITTFRQGLDCESICDPPGGQGCVVASRDPRNLYTNCPLLSRPPVNHRSG